ncbi:MAG: hypothetical protein GTO02_13015 [Candidatus Dadabacteria bacterium]|nr:hypothetical protein [Candidatus Dadabacteria bacterium]NIQ15271.1 hypothetical protein [Candidatus Dadabacteria bacterium]
MPKKNRKKVKDLVEMLQDPDNSGYIGSDIDELELYEQELEEMEDEIEDDEIEFEEYEEDTDDDYDFDED